MTASNHFLAGALIGASVANIWVAIPAAFVSHFILDTLPHYGYEGAREKRRFGFSLFRWVLSLDVLMFLFLTIAVTFFIGRPELLFFGLVAYSPDLIWVHRFVLIENFGRRVSKSITRFEKVHAGIQKLEHPYGLLIEVPLFVLMLLVLVNIT